MEIEKKYMSKENWKRVIDKKYVHISLKEDSKQGEAGLIYIKNVTQPLYKKYNFKNIKLADKGYYWLQIALKNENYWVTAMYDENKNLIQYYIDITNENIIKEEGNSYFYDLFLDIIDLGGGQPFIVDEEELKMALINKVITKEQYNMAYETADKVILDIKKDNSKIKQLCSKYFEKLYKILEE